LAQEFYNVNSGIWSRDGKRILFSGSRDAGPADDWWTMPPDGGPIVRCDAAAVLKSLPASPDLPQPREWLDDYVLFTRGNLWRIRLSPQTFKAIGTPERLTSGSGTEVQPRAILARGQDQAKQWRIVFASGTGTSSLWGLNADRKADRLIGDLAPRTTPSLSSDGKRLTYVMRGLDGFGVRARDMATGAETTLVQSPVDVRARLSPDGTVLAYNPTAQNETESVIFLIPFAGGEAKKPCETCGLIYDWSPDGRKIVFRSGRPMRFSIIDVVSSTQNVILAHPKYQLQAAVYSPDSRWSALHFAPGDGPGGVFLAPAGNGVAGPENQWIHFMNRPGRHTRPWWSRDGNVLMFLSDAGGQVDIWMQRLDAATKRPIGEPEVLFHPSDRFRISTGSPFGPGLGPNRLVFPMSEETRNIWIAE
jgi:Tol biopolymer transport system component